MDKRIGKWLVCVTIAALPLSLAACGGSDGKSSAKVAAGGKIDGGGKSFVYNAAGASAPFAAALKASFLKAFDEKYNFRTTVDSFCCGIDKLQAAQKSGNVNWSAIQWQSFADYRLAKKAGLLLPLDTKVVPVGLLKPGTYDKYGYQIYISGVNLAWLPKTYPAGSPHPEKLEDLFDTKRFPGKRCLYQGAQFGGNFEGAQLAAGIPADKLYPINFDVAFAQLNKIKKDIVWWKEGAEAAQNLLSGRCKFGVIWNGVAQSTANAGNPIELGWDHAIVVYGMNTVPKGSPNPQAAQAFLGLILKDQAAYLEFLKHTAYTLPLKSPPSLPADVAKWAPQGDKLATTIPEDDVYYAANNAEITKRFNDWLVTGK